MKVHTPQQKNVCLFAIYVSTLPERCVVNDTSLELCQVLETAEETQHVDFLNLQIERNISSFKKMKKNVSRHLKENTG